MPNPIYSLDGDTSGLPKTRRTGIAYEVEALTPREVWGAGNSSTSVVCRQLRYYLPEWIKDMVGSVRVVFGTSQLTLERRVPQPLPPGEEDGRIQFCSMLDQTEQGGNPGTTANPDDAPNFGNLWPRTAWAKFRATFEAFPYAILDKELPIFNLPSTDSIASAAGIYAGSRELYRYVIRSRKTYSREQPIPAASTAGGFKVIDDVTPANRKAIGQIGFQVVGMVDLQYKWVRVPIGWPPTLGYLGVATVNPTNPWPPPFNPAAIDPTANKRARDAYKGSINDDWFDVAAPDGYAWPPGTLLYLGYDDSNRYFDAAGDWVCDVVYSFKAKRSVDNANSYGGWNHYLDARGQWKEVSLDGTSTGTKPYKTNPFNNLFQYA